MKGLLLKDWYVLLRQTKWTLAVVLVYACLPLAGSQSFLSAFAIIFCAMLPLTLMSLDEKTGFDRYALALPCSRRDVVLSRYLLGLGAVSAVTLLLLVSAVSSLIYDKEDLLSSVCGTAPMLASGLLYLSILLPIAFRFGVEKARLWFVLVTAVLAGSIAAVVGILPSEQTALISFIDSHGILWLVPAALLLFGLSLLLSLRVYEKREL